MPHFIYLGTGELGMMFITFQFKVGFSLYRLASVNGALLCILYIQTP